MAPTRTLLAAAAAAAAALPAGVAHAAPHWSSPDTILPAPTDTTQYLGAPAVLATPTGGLAAFSSDGVHPVALSGTIAAGFGAPVALSQGTAPGVQPAVGADGTLAAAWTEDNAVKVATAPPGGVFGPAADLPGERVNALDVAVAGDGSVTVAYRTRSADNVYDVLAATAPKGGSFGTPQMLESGKNGVNPVDVAAGPDGALAVTWTRIASVYRTRAAVKPAGAAQFEPTQVLSSATKADLRPRAAFDADGTVVVAWGNPDGGQAAFRPAGANQQFGAAVPLGHVAYNVDLEPTPQGSTVIAFAGEGSVFAGTQSGNGFSVAPAGGAPGEVPPDPQIAVDTAGAPLLLYAESQSGEVRANQVGGRANGGVSDLATVIGYGKPGTLTPVSLATVGAGKAVALWRDAQGAIAAATYGEDAPPATGPGPKPAAPDRIAPKLTRASPRRLSIARNARTITLTLRCDEACAIGAQSELHTTRAGKQRLAPLPFVDSKQAPLRTGRQTLTIKLGTLGRADLVKAFKAKRGAQLLVRANAVDVAANERRVTFRITLREKRAKRRS